MMPAGPLKMCVLKPFQFVRKARVIAQIDKLLGISLKIIEHWPEAFDVNVFPTAIKDHREAGIVLIDAQSQPRLAC